MEALFVWLTTLVYACLFVAWSKSSWFDTFIKTILFVITVLGVVLLYKNNGYTGIHLVTQVTN